MQQNFHNYKLDYFLENSFNLNFVGNTRQSAGFTQWDTKAGVMENGERFVSNSP